MKQRFNVMVAALWWGSLTALGFVVVPMLFANLGTPAVAGAMAAKLFTAQTWLSAGCAMLLLVVLNKKDDQALAQQARAAMKFVVAGLLLALLVEFGIAPRIVSARAEGGNLKLWHGPGYGPLHRSVAVRWRGALASEPLDGNRNHLILPDKPGPRNWLCQAAGAAAPSGGQGATRSERPWGPFQPRSAASRVLTSSMVMVMGPTPPGTGVM